MFGQRAESWAGRSPSKAVGRPYEAGGQWTIGDQTSLLPLPATFAALAALILAQTPGFSPTDTGAAIVASAVAALVAVAIVPLANRAGGAFADSGSGDQLLYVAALTSAGAAAVHFSVIKMHLDEYTLYGTFFVASGIAQLVWPIWLLLQRRRPLLVLGAVGNLSIVALWILDRVGAMPIGPDAYTPSHFGVGDSIASGFEVVTAVACITALVFRKGRPLHARTNVALTLGTVALTTLAFLSVLGVSSSVLPPAM